MDDPSHTFPSRSSWSFFKRLLFRFVFSYLVLYNVPFPLDAIPWFGPLLSQAYQAWWDRLVPWAGQRLLGLKITVRPAGSGDTTYNYVQLLLFVIIAAAAAAVWTVLDRKRPEYTRWYAGLRVYVRFALAAAMLSYGAYKVIPSQFALPFPSQLVETFGEASPMGLLWKFMGASSAYTIFAGAGEMLSGFLLCFRRTALAGALVGFGVMSQVVVLNFSYDIPVKLYSSHLLAMAVFLILPDVRRLLNLLVLNRQVEPAAVRPPRPRFRRAILAVQAVLVAAFSGYLLHQSYDASKQYGNLSERPSLYGVWTVEELASDGTDRPPLLSDASRWRRFIIDYSGSLDIQLMDGSQTYYGLALGKRRLALKKNDDHSWHPTFAYQQTQPGIVALAGTMDGHSMRIRLRREDDTYRLVSRGFHWINERPFNR
jgi:hypothetical protein